MSQITAIDQQPARAVVASGAKLGAMIPTDIDQAYRLAKAIAMSGMAPKAYGTSTEKTLVGILAGMEVGLTPFAALQSIAVIGNNPALWGDGALALVQASGLLEDMEETDDGQKATCRLNRKGRATAIVRSFSMDDAKKAGLTGKAGPWSQYPARMRQMRARSWAMRDGFADVLKGLSIAKEVRDYTPMGGAVPMSQPLTATALLAPAQPDTETVDVETGEIVGEGPADEQMGEAHASKDALADILMHLARKELVTDVNSLVAARVNDLDDEDRATLMQAQMERIAEIKGA